MAAAKLALSAIRRGSPLLLQETRSGVSVEVRCSPVARQQRFFASDPKEAKGNSNSLDDGKAFSTCGTHDPDLVLFNAVKVGVQQGLTRALDNIKPDQQVGMKLSVIKDGVYNGVQDVLKKHNIVIDMKDLESETNLKLAVKEAVEELLIDFLKQVVDQPDEAQGADRLFKLAAKQAFKDGLQELSTMLLKFEKKYDRDSKFVSASLSLTIKDLLTLKKQTKKGDYVMDFFGQRTPEWAKTTWAYISPVFRYGVGGYMATSAAKTIYQSNIPIGDYKKVFEAWRLYTFNKALEYYSLAKEKEKKDHEEELRLAKVKEEELRLAKVKEEEMRLAKVKVEELQLAKVEEEELRLAKLKEKTLEEGKDKDDSLEESEDESTPPSEE